MGSYIYLKAGGLQIDWGKNHGYVDYSSLFLRTDKYIIPYDYADNIVEYKSGYTSSLKNVKQRLDLLGFSLDKLKDIYENNIEYLTTFKTYFNYESLVELLQQVDLNNYTKGEYIEDAFGTFVFEEFSRQEGFTDYLKSHEISERSIIWDLGLLPALFSLRLFAENPSNEEVRIEWHTSDLIEGGWATEEELSGGVDEAGKFLIVTEGNSDTFIVRKAIELLRPDIAEFFRFIDMEDNYPFTGSGNLFRFCQGLVSIGIQNKVLVIFDNDTEGNDKYNRVAAMKLPSEMKVMKLPYLAEFTTFTTIGPTGESIEDINGKAVAIECFLDFFHKEQQIPKVRWMNYVKDYSCYQGSLENKDDYVRKFKQVKSAEDKYDFTKLNLLINTICKACY